MGGFDRDVAPDGVAGAPHVVVKGFSLWGNVGIRRKAQSEPVVRLIPGAANPTPDLFCGYCEFHSVFMCVGAEQIRVVTESFSGRRRTVSNSRRPPPRPTVEIGLDHAGPSTRRATWSMNRAKPRLAAQPEDRDRAPSRAISSKP